MRKIYTLAVLSLITLQVAAQTGEISGRVYDAETDEGISFGFVVLYQNDVQKATSQTDFDGYYVIKPLNPGTYTLKIQFINYNSTTINEVHVQSDQSTPLDIKMTPIKGGITLKEVRVSATPIIEVDKTVIINTITSEEIKQISTRGTTNTASLGSNIFQRDDDDGLNISGSRGNATKYYVDGIPMRESINLPTSSIEQLSTITGGIPSRYGDATGGIVSITTKGPSSDYHGGFELITSQFLDAYGYNLASLNLSGPIYTKYKSSKGQGDKDSSDALIGFFLSFEFEHNKDSDPSAVGMWQVNDDVLANLQQNPLTPSQVGTGFVPTASYITENDLQQIDYKQNIADNNFRGSGKIDFQLNDYINMTLGAQTDISSNHGYNYIKQMFSSESNQFTKNNTYRGFLRFTQRFPTNYGDSAKSASVFRNAYYTLQVDFTKFYQEFGDKELWFDPFKYGHVGNFTTYRQPVYGFGTDSATGLTGYMLLGYADTLVTFEPGTENEYLTNWTEQYYSLAGDNSALYYSSLFQIQNGGGLLNGDGPPTVYSMWQNTGSQVGTYGLRNRDQYRLSLNASVDIVTSSKSEKGGERRHALEFGFEYEQRIDRGYTVAPVGLWTLARQHANSHILQLDLANPHPVYDETGGVFLDTINYDRLVQYNQQSWFDNQLREALGYGPTDFIDIDALDPSVFSLSMFSPDELLSEGNTFYFAFGYDYLGNRLSKQPTFDDFFNAKDENGNYTRNIAAFQPIYTAAYIQDKFNFKDLIFNIGLRVDRYDANQPVLKDPYSLIPIRTAGEVGDFGAHPGTIGNDFYVYVNDIANPTEIAGYRDGETWYNAEGTEIDNPGIIAAAANDGQITPYFVSNDVDNLEVTSESFEDYTPQFTVMPRIAFSFPISETALFFAHYDVLSQRPAGSDARGFSFGTPYDYYFLEQINTDANIANPALKPERTIDYQVGFKQALSPKFAVTISGTYRELKDMIQARNIVFAYPVDYTTFANFDFGTVKSMAVTIEMRRIKNVKIDANYTLQFAEGTGSSETSQLNLLNSGQPYIRALLPFSYDQRHTFTTAVDYRFGEGINYDGPKVGKNSKGIFQNTGLNAIFRVGSGTPYSRQLSATPSALFGIVTGSPLEGSINGSRLPWTFKLDTKIDKDFKLKGTEEGKGLYLNVYCLFQNVLNTKNIVSVYPYTGNPDDDGYVTSSVGEQAVENSLNPESYLLLYGIKTNNPNNYTQPRRIHFGAVLNF